MPDIAADGSNSIVAGPINYKDICSLIETLMPQATLLHMLNFH